MDNVVLNLTGMVQLAAIGPCAFIVLYLLFTIRNVAYGILPVLFFLSLCCLFLLPVLAIFPEVRARDVYNIILFNEDLLPILSFLLIIQFIQGRPPSWKYWMTLLVPFTGLTLLVVVFGSEETLCLYKDNCGEDYQWLIVYRVVLVSFIFLLLIPTLQKIPPDVHRKGRFRHKYWLAVMLIALNLVMLVADMALLSGYLDAYELQFVKTMIGIGFIYLVLTSIFRVFNTSKRLKSRMPTRMEQKDQEHLQEIERILAEEKPYLHLSYHRRDLSDHLRITEQHLSRIINTYYKQSFTELMNEMRIKEAKERLVKSTEPITSISFDVGFTSITSFNRVFKRATGLAPSAYRRRHREV